ncbi:FAD-binding monooxygenase, partial [Phycomyces blakesleeanus]
MITVDVLVCGAGPVGLFFGYLMAIKGHSVYVFDKIAEPSENSRALLITSRTLEMFSLVGLDAAVLKEARIFFFFFFFFVKNQIKSNYNLIPNQLGTAEASGDTTFPQQNILPQVRLERILETKLASQGYPVHWSTTLTAYSQTDSGIEATLSTQEEQEQNEGLVTVRASYMVGADGTHSAVRR